MNGDTIAWFLVERASADHPDLADGKANVPRGTVFATRAEADEAASGASRDDHGHPNVIVAELVDRRTDQATEGEHVTENRTVVGQSEGNMDEPVHAAIDGERPFRDQTAGEAGLTGTSR